MKATHIALLLTVCLICAADDRLNFNNIDPDAAGMDARRLALIPVRLQAYVDSNQAAGMVTIVGRHGKVVSFEAVGYQDVESKKPMRKDTLFRIASLTKPITCAGIMVLVDAGQISVIDSIEKYLPEFKGLKVRGCRGDSGYGCDSVVPVRPVNIEDLMTHTSGFESSFNSSGGAALSTLGERVSRESKTELLFDPGTRWNYSNIGYDILGRIIEVVAKKPFDAFLKEHIFDPLGMNSTTFFVSQGQMDRVATLYTLTLSGLTRSPNQLALRSQSSIPAPAGGLVSTAEDIFRFNMMIRNKGTLDGKRVLSAAAVGLMTMSHTGDLKAGWVPGVGHGYGYEVVRNSDGMFRYNSIGSCVKGGAYRTYEWIDPEKDLVGVFMMQLTNGGGDTADEINSFMAMSAAGIK